MLLEDTSQRPSTTQPGLPCWSLEINQLPKWWLEKGKFSPPAGSITTPNVRLTAASPGHSLDPSQVWPSGERARELELELDLKLELELELELEVKLQLELERVALTA